MSQLTLQNITKQFGLIKALNDISFEVKDQEFFVLLGPTGAGKTTTLRVVCGLEKPEAGHVLFNDEIVDGYSPAERDVAIVFQQYSLYPTLTVFDNMAFPLKAPGRTYSKDEIKTKIEETAEKLRISHLLHRKTAQLSGGEMQRVAIGRAIVRRPQIFLMDEPLSNLDAKLRESLRAELQHLQKIEGVTTLYVTHDQIEALTMADRIGVINEGKLIQVGTPEDIYDRPASTFVATLVGSPRINLLDTVNQDRKVKIVGTDFVMKVPENLDLPESFELGIRPENVILSPEGEFSGKVKLLEPLGVETIVHISNGEKEITSLITGLIKLDIGEDIRFNIDRNRLHYFTSEGNRII
jgi:multiple sugar transport system ATP-binding protein